MPKATPAPRPGPAIPNLASLRLTGRPNDFLMAPAGVTPLATPHAPSPIIAATPTLVAARLMEGPAQEPRTHLDHGDTAAHSYHFVQRSAVFRFADDIYVWLREAETGTCPVIYSRARVGHSDLGVNRRRVMRWLRALAG